ncbi:MAG: TolC family protein [Bacteroidetes bacterium]|nr:TolC family protein [Bacteroidota bacterium]
MRKLIAIIICISSTQVKAQSTSDKWDLRKCVEYAVKNNISVKQADIQARITALQLKQNKLFQYPTTAFNTNGNLQLGRSIDPTTNQFTTTELISQSYALQGGMLLYNWGRLKNSIAAAQLSTQAALADIEKAANDVSLTVANYYLNVLAAKQQIDIANVQVKQTNAQLDITKKKVNAGALPELNQVQLEAQLATDSSNLITAQSNYELNILSLKGALSIDAATPFEVITPTLDKIPLESLLNLQPDIVYQLALTTQPLQKGDSLRIKAAEKSLLANKSALYPSLSANYVFASAFNNKAIEPIGSTQILPPIGTVKVGSTDYNVFPLNPYTVYTYGKSGYFSQLNNNFSQSIGLSLSVPIFSNGQRKITYEQSKLTLKNAQLQNQQDNLTLKNNIYTSYTNVVTSLQKYNASIRAVESAQKAYDFAQKRYENGLLSTYDLIVTQNSLTTAKLQQLANQYDYVFKIKLLEFYKGQGIKL